MSATAEARRDVQSTRLSRLRKALSQRYGRGRATALVVAASYVALALLDGGTEPGLRALAALVLWVAVILGLVLGLWPRATVPRPALLAGALLGGLAALTGLSLTWAADNGAAFNETIRVLAYLGLFVTVVLASSQDSARSWFTGLALGLGATVALAVVSRTQPGLIAAAEAIREDFAPAQGLLSYPGGYWNGLGAMMAIASILFAWLSVDARDRRSRAVATAAIPVAGLVLFLTGSRGAIGAAIVGALALLALARRRPVLVGSFTLGAAGSAALILLALALAPDVVTGELATEAGARQGDLLLAVSILTMIVVGAGRYLVDPWLGTARPPRLVSAVALATACVAVAAGAVLLDPGERLDEFRQAPQIGPQNPGADLLSTGGGGRWQYWQVGFGAFAGAPVLGVGAGGFEAEWDVNHTIPFPVTFAHSIVVGFLAELGLAGVLLVAAFFTVVVAAGLRARRHSDTSLPAVGLAIIAIGLVTAAIDWMWEFPAAFVPVIVACGLLTGPAISRASEQARSRFGFGVAALVAGWLAVVVTLLSFFGEQRIESSREALEAGRLELSVERAETASTVLPWDSDPYVLKAAALEGMGDLDGAEDAIAEALEREPTEATIWTVAARIHATAGNEDQADEASANARRFTPSAGRTP